VFYRIRYRGFKQIPIPIHQANIMILADILVNILILADILVNILVSAQHFLQCSPLIESSWNWKILNYPGHMLPVADCDVGDGDVDQRLHEEDQGTQWLQIRRGKYNSSQWLINTIINFNKIYWPVCLFGGFIYFPLVLEAVNHIWTWGGDGGACTKRHQFYYF